MATKAGAAYIDVDANLAPFKKQVDATVKGEAKKAGAKFKSGFGGAFQIGAGIAGVDVATRAFGFLKDSISEAASENKDIAILARTLKNAGVPPKTIASTEKWITKLQNATGVMDDELRPALAKLISSGVPVGKAQEVLSKALDISAAKGKPLAAVVTALGKAYNGNVGALQRLGIDTSKITAASKEHAAAVKEVTAAEANWEKKAANLKAVEAAIALKRHKTPADLARLKKAQDEMAAADDRTVAAQDRLRKSTPTKSISDFDKVLGLATKTMGGAAKAAAETGAGKLAIMRARFKDLKEQIGNALMPVLTNFLGILLDKIVPVLQAAADWISKNKGVIVPLVAVLASAAVAFKVASIAVGIFNAVMDANPVVLIVAGLAALVVGLVVAYNKVGWFRAFVDGAFKGLIVVGKALWTGIKWAWDNIGRPIFDFVKDHIGTVVAAAKLYFAGLKLEFAAIWTAGRWVWDHVGHPIFSGVLKAVGWVRTAIGQMRDAFSTVWNAISDKIKWVNDHIVQPIYDKIKWVIDHLPFIGGVDTTKGPAKQDKQRNNSFLPGGGKASGGIVRPGYEYDIGEYAPEKLRMFPGGGGEVIPTSTAHASRGVTINNHFYQSGQSPEQVTNAQRRAERLAMAL